MAGEEDESVEIQLVPGELQGTFFVKAAFCVARSEIGRGELENQEFRWCVVLELGVQSKSADDRQRGVWLSDVAGAQMCGRFDDRRGDTGERGRIAVNDHFATGIFKSEGIVGDGEVRVSLVPEIPGRSRDEKGSKYGNQGNDREGQGVVEIAPRRTLWACGTGFRRL